MTSDAMPASGTGRCLCGALRYAWSEQPLWTAHCFCESCRRNCSAPMTSVFAVADNAWRWTGAEPSTYDSSSHTKRFFCARCGTPMALSSDHYPGETDFYAASMDEPERFKADKQFHADERLSWLHLADTLPDA